MSILDTLKIEYPGDEAWQRYASVFRPVVTKHEANIVHLIIPEDESLAETLVGLFGQLEAAAWVERPNDALDGLSPRQVLASVEGGDRIVRHAVMRIPL